MPDVFFMVILLSPAIAPGKRQYSPARRISQAIFVTVANIVATASLSQSQVTVFQGI
jgi:hypothetical protein